MACGISVVHVPRRSCTTCTTARRDLLLSACAFGALIGIQRCPRGQAPSPALRRPATAVYPMVCADCPPFYPSRVTVCSSIHGQVERLPLATFIALYRLFSYVCASTSPPQPAVSRTSNRLRRRTPSPWRGDATSKRRTSQKAKPHTGRLARATRWRSRQLRMCLALART
jgi:hypothetical protein